MTREAQIKVLHTAKTCRTLHLPDAIFDSKVITIDAVQLSLVLISDKQLKNKNQMTK